MNIDKFSPEKSEGDIHKSQFSQFIILFKIFATFSSF